MCFAFRRMDHHCPWLNNCVGERNQKYFLQFLVYVGFLAIYSVALVVGSWVYPCDTCSPDLPESQTRMWVFLFFFLVMSPGACSRKFELIFRNYSKKIKINFNFNYKRWKPNFLNKTLNCIGGPGLWHRITATLLNLLYKISAQSSRVWYSFIEFIQSFNVAETSIINGLYT